MLEDEVGQTFVDWLNAVEGGQELLINLVEGVRDGSVSQSLLQAFASECVARLDSLAESGPIDGSAARNAVNYVVFDPPKDAAGDPMRFQYSARRTAPTPGRVETFLTWPKLRRLIPKESELAQLIQEELDKDKLDTTDPRYNDADDMEAVARLINKHGPTMPEFRLSTLTKAGSPQPIWMTTAADADRVHASERELLATRIRDWLGLGFASDGVSFFAFTSLIPLDAAATADHLSRPTVFDGIDHFWFKHRTHDVCRHGWGRTLDFVRARRGEMNCDGGPEAVAPGSTFGTLFECRYVGRLMSAPMPAQPFVLQALLSAAADKDAEIGRLAAELNESLEARP